MNFDPNIAIEALLALGVFGVVRRLATLGWKRWRTGSTSEQATAKIDATARLQDIALELVSPIRTELNQARTECADLRKQMGELTDDFEALFKWARAAMSLLDQHNLSIAPLPIRRVQ